MEKVTAKEFKNNFGEYSAKAERKPVTITKHGKPRLVVISIEDFMQIIKSTQKALHVSELSPEQRASIRNAKAPEENEYLNELLED